MDFFKALVDLVYPRICAVCKNRLDVNAIQGMVCASCWGSIIRNRLPFCPCSGGQEFAFDRAFAACAYTGAMKTLLHEFKYSKKDYLGRLIAALMIEQIRECAVPVAGIDMIVPVPLAKARLRQREFNQALVLSRHIAEEFDKPVAATALARIRNTPTQTELSPEERFVNISGSFRVTEPARIKDKNILLVDDVLTTGATVSEAAKELKSCGGATILVIAAAN